jgi:hypothetical protein
MQLLCSLLALLSVALKCGQCIDVGLTVDVAPGTSECFHQDIRQGTQYEVEYQVSSLRNCDINI